MPYAFATMNIRSLNTPHIWDCLSRTRPLPPNSIATRLSDRRSKSIITDICRPSFGYLLYQGLGATGPFGLCYVVGVVVGGIGGEGITLAMFLASITSLLTGLCYAELLCSSRECSGNGITAVYQLVGEFPAFCLALYSFTISCCGFAALSKALSATVEELSHRKLSTFLSSLFGTLPLSEIPPDLFATGTAMVASLLLACGLKQAGFLRTAMNMLCICAFCFFMIVGSSHTRTNASKVEETPPKHRQILAGAGILSCLFFQFLELGRRSKAEMNTNTKMPLAVTFITGGVFLAALSLAILLSLMMDNRPPASGAPLLQALQLRDVGWARFAMGSLQVVILSLGVSEAGEALARQLVAISSNGFIPAFISRECSMSFTHSCAYLVGGIWVGTLAMFLTHVYLLELMAVNVVLANTLITFVALYRPHRSAYDSLYAAIVSRASKGCLQPPRFKNVPEHPKRAPEIIRNQLIKGRLSLAKFMDKKTEKKIRDDEMAVPLLSFQFSEESELETDDGEDGQNEATTNENILKDIIFAEDGTRLSRLNINRENETVTSSPEVTTKEIETDSKEASSDEDIDTIVAEYKEKLRVSTSGSKISIAPTGVSARKALLLTLGISVTTFFITLYSLKEVKTGDSVSSLFRNASITVMCVIDLIMVLLLGSLPTLRRPIGSFNVPFIVKFVTLVLNALLFTELLTRTLWTIIPLNTIGILWYIFYACKNSVASNHSGERLVSPKNGTPREFIRLLPLSPVTISTSTPQNNLMKETYANRIIL